MVEITIKKNSKMNTKSAKDPVLIVGAAFFSFFLNRPII